MFNVASGPDQGLRVGRVPVDVITVGVEEVDGVESALAERTAVTVSSRAATAANAMSFPICFICLFSYPAAL
jgi:hypothetical protein